MSIRNKAIYEMDKAGFEETDKDAVKKILDIFFETWDSGGAVWAMAPVLNRLICGKCLTPLTGEDDEWMNITEHLNGQDIYQNIRISSVFKEPDGLVHDLDNPKGPREPITFPYFPREAVVADPVISF